MDNLPLRIMPCIAFSLGLAVVTWFCTVIWHSRATFQRHDGPPKVQSLGDLWLYLLIASSGGTFVILVIAHWHRLVLIVRALNNILAGIGLLNVWFVIWLSWMVFGASYFAGLICVPAFSAALDLIDPSRNLAETVLRKPRSFTASVEAVFEAIDVDSTLLLRLIWIASLASLFVWPPRLETVCGIVNLIGGAIPDLNEFGIGLYIVTIAILMACMFNTTRTAWANVRRFLVRIAKIEGHQVDFEYVNAREVAMAKMLRGLFTIAAMCMCCGTIMLAVLRVKQIWGL